MNKCFPGLSNTSAIYIEAIINIMQICSGITRGRVLNGELYTQRFLKANANKLLVTSRISATQLAY